MRNWFYLTVSVALLSNLVLANPTNFLLSTDAPGNVPSSNLYYLKPFVSTDRYTGNIILDFNDLDREMDGIDVNDTGADSPFRLETFRATSPTDGDEEASEKMKWGTHITMSANNNAGVYQFVIENHSIGATGHNVFFQYTGPVSGNIVFSENYAFKINDQGLGGDMYIASPVAVDSESNFVGVGDYTLSAGNVSAGNLAASEFAGAGSNVVAQMHTIEFYGTSVTVSDNTFNSTILSSNTVSLSGTTVGALANFSSSANRLNFIRPYGYDPAGNEYPGNPSVQLAGEEQWVALGQFGEDSLYGDNIISGNWTVGTDYITAGNYMDLVFYATDFYGQRVTDATVGSNVSFTMSSMNAQTGFDGSVPSTLIVSGNQDTFGTSANGQVYYDNQTVFYRQESITINPTVANDDLFGVESPIIVVKHNIINDIVFALSTDISTNSGNGVSTLTPSLTGAYAGNTYSVNVVAVDAYQNITITPDYGDGGTVTISSNFNNGYAHGYTPFGETAYDYTPDYSDTLNFAGNAGILDATDIVLYRAETNTLIMTIGGSLSDGTNSVTANDNLDLTVTRNSGNIVLFDDNGDYTDGYLLSTNTLNSDNSISANAQAAGNMFTLYGQISDPYGNPDTTAGNSIFIMPYTDASGNAYTDAWRNDASVVNLTVSASSGNLGFADLQVDHATPTSGANSAIYPWTAFGFEAVATDGLSLITSRSPAFQIAAQPSSNVYFTNSDGVPYSLSVVQAGSFISGATAGTNIDFYGAVGDQYGNVEIAESVNTMTIDVNNFSAAPDFTYAAPGNVTRTVASGQSGNLTITPYAAEIVTSANIILNANNNTIHEQSGQISVTFDTASLVDFVDSSGNYSSDNTFATGNVAGNAFTLYVGALDAYRNAVTSYSTGTLTVSANTTSSNIYAPLGGYAAHANVSSWSGGFASVNITLFDADSTSVIDVYHDSGLTTTASTSFDIAANEGETIVFVDGNVISSFNNDTFSGNATGASDNLVLSTTTLTAGESTYIYPAFTDLYGNFVAENDTVTLAAGTSAPSISPSGQWPTYGSNTLDSSIAEVKLTLFDSTSSVVQVSASSGNASYSSNINFVVDAASAANIKFLTSTGNSSKTNGSSVTSGSSPVGPGVAGTPLDDVYIGILDQWDNPVLTATNGNIVISGNTDANIAYGSNPTITGGNITIGISGNLNSDGYIFFDDSDSSKSITITAPTTGNTLLDVHADNYLSLGSGNSNVFFMGDSVPPSVTVNAPAAGEQLYPGNYNIGWTVTDTDVSGTGNTVISLSLDDGATYSENLTTTLANSDVIYTWTVAANQTTSTAKLRVQVTDDLGNVGEGFSDTFSISPSASVIDYVVGDADSSTVTVYFRENVYSNTGADLEGPDFNPGTVTVNADAAHTAGQSSAVLTLSSTLGTGNVGVANIAPVSGNVSPNSDGSSAYTSATTIASANIHQLYAESLGITQTTASSSQNIMGMRLVGWDDDDSTSGNSYTLKQINVTITQIGGVITTDDFAAGSTNSLTSGVGLFDSNGSPLTLDSAPTIAIGSSFGLAYSGNLPTDAITGSTNFNFKVGVLTSSTISDAAGDSFTVTVDSVEIIDSETSDNIQKIYVPHGTRTSDPVVADTTAYSTPTISITDPVNMNNVTTQTIEVTGDAGADASITYFVVNTDSGNTLDTVSSNIEISGLGITSANVAVDLSDFSGNTSGTDNVQFSVNVHLLDGVGNSSGVASSTFTYDLVPPASGNISMDNIIASTVASANLDLSELETSANVYSIVLTDIVGGTVTLTSAFTPSASNTHTVESADLSSLSDGNILIDLTITDDNGNSTAIHSTNTVTKDATAPTISAINISSSGNFTDLTFTFTTDDAAGAVNFVITDSAGTTLSSNVDASTGTANLILTGFTDGTVTVSANSTDTVGNLGVTASNTTTLDTTGPAAPTIVSPVASAVVLATPTFTWTNDSDVNNYYLLVSDNVGTAISYDVVAGTNTYLAFTSSSNYSSNGNLAVGDYVWKIRGRDTTGNWGSYSSEGAFSVVAPDAPVVISPIGREATTDTPNYRWSSVTEAVSYQFSVELDNGSGSYSVVAMSDNTTTGTNLISSDVLSDGVYRWRVQSVDQFGHTSDYSDYAEFSVNIPMLQYVVGDIGSNELKAVFNKAVYGNDNDTGSVDTNNLDIAGLGGAASVTHNAGDAFLTILTAQTVSDNTSAADGINSANVAASSTTPIYGEGGAEASTAAATVRQVAAAANVTTQDGVTFGGSAVELMNFSIGGWSSANVELKAINFTITPIAGTVTDADFTGLSLVGPNGTITTSVNTSSNLVGVSQTLTLTTDEQVGTSAVSSPNFSLQVTPASGTTTDSIADVFKFELESVVLDIDNVESTRLVSGDEETSNVILTNVSLTVTDEDSSGIYVTDELLTVTATNGAPSSVATYAWAQTSGESVTILNGETSAMSFQASGNGTYGFDLTYTRGSYALVKSVSITVITKPQEEALSDLLSEASTLDSAEEFTEALNVFADFTSATISDNQAMQLVGAAEGLVDQLVANSNIFTPSEAELDNLFMVIDKSVDPTGGLDSSAFDSVEDVLMNFSSLPVTGDQTQVGFKVLEELSELASGNSSITFNATAFNAVISSLSDAANQSLEDSGTKTIAIDSSANVKYYSTRMNTGETSTASLSGGSTGTLLTVTVSPSTLAEISPAGAGNTVMLSTYIVEDTTSAANLASRVYNIDIYETDGDSSAPVTVSGLTNAIEVKIAIDNYDASQGYEIRFRSSGSAAFATDPNYTISISSTGEVTFTTDHLTEFAVFESDDAAVTTGGGGGGGCLLK